MKEKLLPLPVCPFQKVTRASSSRFLGVKIIESFIMSAVGCARVIPKTRRILPAVPCRATAHSPNAEVIQHTFKPETLVVVRFLLTVDPFRACLIFLHWLARAREAD